MFDRKHDKDLEEKRLQILARIKPVIARALKIGEDKVAPELNLIDDLGVDSLDTIELTMSLEEEFNIEIPDEDAERMATIEDIARYLAKVI